MIGQTVNFLIVHWVIVTPVVLLALLVLSRGARTAGALVLRLIARPLLLLAVLALVYDGTRTIAGGSGFVITSLAEHWQATHPTSLALVKSALSQLHPLAWDRGALLILKLPAWIIAGALGLLLAYIGRKRRQVNVYAN